MAEAENLATQPRSAGPAPGLFFVRTLLYDRTMLNYPGDEAEPKELCFRCHGAGCDFCGGDGELPIGTEQEWADKLSELDLEEGR